MRLMEDPRLDPGFYLVTFSLGGGSLWGWLKRLHTVCPELSIFFKLILLFKIENIQDFFIFFKLYNNEGDESFIATPQ